MKVVDRNVLPRFFVDDPDDTEATRQRAFVPVAVWLEFEGVLRGFYELPRHAVLRGLAALAS